MKKIEDTFKSGYNNVIALATILERGEYGHVDVKIVYRSEDGEIRHYSDYFETCHVHSLKLTCQYNLSNDDLIRVPYAFKLEYDADYIISFSMGNLDKIQERVKFLKLMNRKLQRFTEKFGDLEYNNFGRYVKVMLSLMGIEEVVGNSAGYPFINDIEYHINQAIEHGI